LLTILTTQKEGGCTSFMGISANADDGHWGRARSASQPAADPMLEQ
jgi:hypothetical protein